MKIGTSQLFGDRDHAHQYDLFRPRHPRKLIEKILEAVDKVMNIPLVMLLYVRVSRGFIISVIHSATEGEIWQ